MGITTEKKLGAGAMGGKAGIIAMVLGGVTGMGAVGGLLYKAFSPTKAASRQQSPGEAVVPVARRDARHEKASVRVDVEVPLHAVELPSTVVLLDPAGRGRLDRLGVEHAPGRGRFAPRPLAVRHDEEMVDPLDQTRVAPAVEVALHRGERRELLREMTPLTTRAEQVENRLEDEADIPLPWSSSSRRDGEERLDHPPRIVGDETTFVVLTAARFCSIVVPNGDFRHG